MRGHLIYNVNKTKNKAIKELIERGYTMEIIDTWIEYIE